MNIYGIGTDIVNVNRIKDAIKKNNQAFKKRIYTNFEIKNNSLGAPKLVLKGLSLRNLKKILKNKKFKIHLSLSDDKPWAVASVIIFTYK